MFGVHEQERDRQPGGRLLYVDGRVLVGLDGEGVGVVGYGAAGRAVVIECFPAAASRRRRRPPPRRGSSRQSRCSDGDARQRARIPPPPGRARPRRDTPRPPWAKARIRGSSATARAMYPLPAHTPSATTGRPASRSAACSSETAALMSATLPGGSSSCRGMPSLWPNVRWSKASAAKPRPASAAAYTPAACSLTEVSGPVITTAAVGEPQAAGRRRWNAWP